MNSSAQSTNRSCQQTYVEMPLDITLYGTVSYSSIFVIGVVGNLLVIFVLTKKRSMRNFTNYLLANLSVADLFVLFTCVPIGLHDLFAKERWYLGKLACYLASFIENCMGFASILSIFFITCDRYYVISRPLHVKSKMNQWRTMKLIVFIWTSSVMVNLPFIYMADYREAEFFDCTMGYKCVTMVNSELAHIYVTFFYLFFYLLVAIVLLIMYLRIYSFLKQSNRFLESFSEQLSSSQNSKPNQANESNAAESSSEKLNANQAGCELAIMPKLTPRGQSAPSNWSSTNNHRHQLHHYQLQNQQQSLSLKRKTNDCSTELGFNNKQVRQRKKIICMLVWLVLSFYIFIFPIKLWTLTLTFIAHKKFFTEWVSLRLYWFINVTVRAFFFLNSSVNPILYNWFSAKFRLAFRNAFLFPQLFIKRNRDSTPNQPPQPY
nr:G protein-coupled receptor [Proales similis]